MQQAIHQFRSQTNLFLRRIGFEVGDRLWIKLSWELPIQFAPPWWRRKHHPNQAARLCHYVFCGKMTAHGFKLRHCVPKGKDHRGVTRWRITRTGYNDGWRFCFERSRQGATVCFYPNQPDAGIGNHHVQHCPCLFYEIDDHSLKHQREMLKRLKQQTGLHPTAVVFSGGKSLHVYLRSDTALLPQDWLRLNRKLCIVQDGDPQICNPARAMRLPGMLRYSLDQDKLGTPTVVTLKTTSSRCYSPEHLEAVLDNVGLFPYGLDDDRWRRWVRLSRQAKTDKTIDPLDALLQETVPRQQSTQAPPRQAKNPPKQVHPSCRASGTHSVTVPLLECLTRDDQGLIDQGVGEGSRNSCGYKLARNLVGTATFLSSQEIGYTPNDPRSLFDDYCDRCIPPLDTVEADTIWTSANARPAEPSRSPESILNTVQYYQRKAEGNAKLRRLLQRLRAKRSQTREA